MTQGGVARGVAGRDHALYFKSNARIYKTGATLAAMRRGGFPFADSEPIAVVGTDGERVPLRRCVGCGHPHADTPENPPHDPALCLSVHAAPPYCSGSPRPLRPRKATQAEMLRLWPAWAPRTPEGQPP